MATKKCGVLRLGAWCRSSPEVSPSVSFPHRSRFMAVSATGFGCRPRRRRRPYPTRRPAPHNGLSDPSDDRHPPISIHGFSRRDRVLANDRLAVFFPALLFGWLREKTGTVLGATLLHAAFNL